MSGRGVYKSGSADFHFLLRVSLPYLWKFFLVVLSVLSLFGILVVLQQHVFHLSNDPIRLFNLDMEGNLPSFFSSLGLFLNAILLFFIAAYKHSVNEKFKWHWSLMAVLFFCMSVDEAAKIHEILIQLRHNNIIDASGFLFFVWVVPGAASVVTFIFVFYRFFLHLPARFKKSFALSSVFYVGGALGMEILNGAYASAYGVENLSYLLQVCLEEILEMAGIVMFMRALVQYTQSEIPAVHITFAQ